MIKLFFYFEVYKGEFLIINSKITLYYNDLQIYAIYSEIHQDLIPKISSISNAILQPKHLFKLVFAN
jgi:hypothetical protein